MCFRRGLIQVGRTCTHPTRPFSHHGHRTALLLAFAAATPTPRRAFVSIESSHANQDTTKIELLAQHLRGSISPKGIADIHRLYPALVKELQKTPSLSSSAPTLDHDQLIGILDVLCTSGRHFDLALVDQILSDMSPVFGSPLTAAVHTAIIRALIKYGNVQSIQNWLLAMPRKPGHLTPSREQWHMFLHFCSERGETGTLRAAIKSMRKTGCKPTHGTFKILIGALFAHSQHIAVLSSALQDMKEERLHYDQSIADMLYDGYSKLNLHKQAADIERIYRAQFTDAEAAHPEQGQNRRLEEHSMKSGARAAVKLCQTFQKDGFTPSPLTLTAILRHSRSAGDIHYAVKELGIPANVIHWSIVIGNTLRAGDVANALSIYHESLKTGIRPDAAMVHPIISTLCLTSFEKPSDSAIDQALEIYQDLRKVAVAYAQAKSDRASIVTQSEHSIGPDAQIYNALLRALASSSNSEKYYPKAFALLDDMKEYNIPVDNSMTAASVTVLRMRNASNFTEAFNAYRNVCIRKDGSSVLDEKGYAVVLNTFCKLSFGDRSFPLPLHHYFDIARDMRTAGLPMTVEIYTILLRQLASLAKRVSWDKSLPENFEDQLVASIRRAHNHLTLDASVTPDAALWNQLMDTYQRAGCFGEAYRVWEMMYLTGRFDNTSVSIILDACGYANAWRVATQICAKLFNDGFSFSQRNWNAWLECLCRLGRLNDAVKLACLEMGNYQGVAPDAESVGILLKFAIQANQESEVKSRIKRYLPELWETLPDLVRGDSG